MSANEIRVGDVGTVFEDAVKDQDGEIVDISTASNMDMIFRKPDNTAIVKTAVHTTDGTDGKMEYVTIADDLDQVREWQRQGLVEVGGGIWRTDIKKFRVYDNLPEPEA